jgi:hypothetical protein
MNPLKKLHHKLRVAKQRKLPHLKLSIKEASELEEFMKSQRNDIALLQEKINNATETNRPDVIVNNKTKKRTIVMDGSKF